EANLSAAVGSGSGLVSFDGDLSDDTLAGRYQFVQDVFGFGYAPPATSSGVVFPATAPDHYVTERHAGGDTIATAALSSAGIVLPAGVASLVRFGNGEPLVAATSYGLGRAVQWASYAWMST